MTQLYSGLTVIEILGVAAKKEVDAAHFYKELAGMIANPVIKERFMTLSREEQRHRALIIEEYKRATGEAKIPLPKGEFGARDTFDYESAGIEEALEYAIKAERDAQKLYTAAAKASSDPRAQRMLEYLVEFERGHERQLKADLDFYRKEPGWFEGRDDFIHVGP